MLLHLSLIIRILGDLTNQFDIRRWGGFLNEIAILLFLAMTIHSIVKTGNQLAKKSSIDSTLS
jgi:hypothetical protein